jgi:O-antigen ligase
LSTVWSDYTFIAFKRWFKDAGDVLMILVILTEADPVEAFRWVFLRCAYMLIPISVLFIKYYPDLGRYYDKWTWETAYCGITTNKNSLGLLAMWSGFVLLWQIVDVHRRRVRSIRLRHIWPDLAVLLMCLWILSIAHSSTSLSCFVLGIAVFFGSRLRVAQANLKYVGWCLAGVAAIMLIFTASTELRGMFAGLLGRNANLTDRTEIWDWALQLHTNPLFGSGFASTLLTYRDAPLVAIDHLAHVHNGYLQTYVDDGMIGVCLLLAIIITAGRNAARQVSEKTVVGHLFAALFISTLFYNYTEVAFNRSEALGFLFWLLAAYGVVRNVPACDAEVYGGLADCAPEANSI